MTAPNGAPILTKSGLNGYPKKVIRRMNDGDILLFDPNDPECPPNTAVQDAMWIDKRNWNQAINNWRERSGYPDGLWPDVTSPWWSYTGFQQRKERFRAISNETKSKYNAPWYTAKFW